jgi:hypothetical protein
MDAKMVGFLTPFRCGFYSVQMFCSLLAGVEMIEKVRRVRS